MTELVRRHRGYFAFATTTLAIAVGVNLVLFTIVNALWLRPLPFKDADRLVTITGRAYSTLDAPTLASFEAVAGQVMTDGSSAGLRPVVQFDSAGRDLETLAVTPQYFSVLGVSIRGRDFTIDDDLIGAEPVAIISHRVWSREFGRRDDVIGRVLGAQPIPLRIIGVAPADFHGARRGERADVWVPRNLVPRLAPTASGPLGMMVFARLPRGEEFTQAAQRLLHTPASDRDREGLTIVPLKDVFGTPTSRTVVIREEADLSVVGGLAMLVLLGGCATLSALVLVHYERRRRDLAVKLALGASPTRLVTDLASELGLILGGGALGAVVIAAAGVSVIPATPLPGGVDLGRLDLSIDWRVLVAAVVLTMFTLVTAAWLPMRRATRASLVGELSGGPTTTASAASQRLRQGLLALHVCTIVVVLVAAGLFVRAVRHGFANAPGFDVDRTAFVTVLLPAPTSAGLSTGSTLETMRERVARAQAVLSSVPGIEAVATGASPIGAESSRFLLSPMSVETGGREREMLVGRIRAGPEFLSALGIPLLSGRGLSETDTALYPAPTIVTGALAEALWPDANPLGQDFSVRDGRGLSRHVVVGVARDFVFGSLSRPAAGAVVVVGPPTLWGLEPRFSVRSVQPKAPVERMRAALREAFPDAPWLRIETAADVIAADLGRQRLGAWFFSGFGVSALLLGIAGVFGLVAYSVESRRREFSLRLALGATPDHLVRKAVAAALLPVSFGVTAGLILAAVIARVFTSLLVGLSTIDPLTYVTIAAAMLTCAAVAGLTAAWPLRNVAPAESLKHSS